MRPARFTDADFVQDADRIAEEVRGLALQRRQSTDTVRSSEFGDGGRWAKAWGDSQDGSDDEDDEDELTLQDMRARDMTDLDIDATGTRGHSASLGALGALGNLQGAYAAMLQPAESSTGKHGGATLPRLHNAAGATHAVSLTPAQRKSSLATQLDTQLNHSYTSSYGQPSGLSRRDTAHSIACEVLDMDDDPSHARFPARLGQMRRKAIEDHDGRESMVSDLDVETLRLDGSSQAGDSRRDSTSTIGSVSSFELDEQRRRRSHMERRDAYDDDRRSSTATIRMATRPPPPPPPSHVQYSHDMTSVTRPISHPSPGKEKLDPFRHAPLQPRRSNTMPDEQPGTPKGALTPWSASTRAGGNWTGGSPLLDAGPGGTSPSIRSTATTPRGAVNGGTRSSAPPPAQSQAENFLTLGITHHESGDLSRSAYYFERSAKVDGGCVVGMCMWGMALREGWGVRKDQKRGFEWISRAASRAGEMMSGQRAGEPGRTEAELKAIRSELKLSVYELGKCFCYGWGVKMDKPMALEYFELAAKLGDADAQAEAGALLAAGKGGCKKDLKRAAMYYRMAEAQGYDTVGLSWIHKDKYDPAPAAAAAAIK